MTDELLHVSQQMLMKRPWDAAEPESVWSITGIYPKGGGTFTDCIAFVLSPNVTGVDERLFAFVGELGLVDKPVLSSWITHARPLLLVHRDEPTEPHYEHDRAWMRSAS
jgi:hypothetical protein